MIQENGIYKWKYHSINNETDPYSDIIEKINICTSEEFNKLNYIEQEQKLDQMVQIIREKNVFPIYYYNDQQIIKEIQKVQKATASFDNDILSIYKFDGMAILDFLFPNLHLTEAGDEKNNSVYERFYNDYKLKKSLRLAIKYGKITNIRTATIGTGKFMWRTATNFVPLRAKAIYEKFCKKDGIILDYSAGFGGRMLGALTSNNNYTYYGIEPNTNTVYNLNRLGEYINKAVGNNKYKIIQSGSEDYCDTSIQADFIFSSPPYFKLERYSKEETQSTIKYNNYPDWLEGYVRPTIKNMKKMLKEDGTFALDINDTTLHGKRYHLTNDWLQICLEEGLFYNRRYKVDSHARKKNKDNNESEFIYIFTKKKIITEYSENLPLTKQKKYVIYDKFGKIIYNTINISLLLDFLNTDINELNKNINTNKPFKKFFVFSYDFDFNYPETIITKIICTIDDLDFYNQSEAARYCNVSRQALNQALNKKAKTLNGKKVTWYN